MAEIIDLDHILLTPRAVNIWMALAEHVARAIQGLEIDPSTIPDEQARVEEDESLTIFVELPDGKGEISLSILPEHWQRRFEKN